MVLAAIGTVNAGNLLVNGDWEDPAGGVENPLDAGWLKWWSTWNCNVYADDPVEDDHSGAIYWNDAGMNQIVTVDPNNTYELGGKLLTTEPGGLVDNLGVLEIKIDDVAQLRLEIVPGDAENVWHAKLGSFDPAGATEITINCAMVPGVAPAGNVLYDDVYFGPLGISKQAKFPVPADGLMTVQADTQDTLIWQNPDPNATAGGTITSDVYLCEGDDPSFLTLIADDTADEFVAVTLTPGSQYCWRVDCTDTGLSTTTTGEVWTLTTTTNLTPTVDAGPDQYLVATASPMVLNLDATVTDDGTPTISWTDLTNDWDKDPDTTVTINSPSTEDTTVTLSNDVSGVVSGYFIFELAVDDGFNDPVVDQVIVIVYNTCAEAADGDPDDDYDITGDLNLDCKKNLADFAIFASGWLDCNINRPADVTCP